MPVPNSQLGAVFGAFGDGSDGDVTISALTTLTRDMYYRNLTVNADLRTGGFRVYVKGLCTINAGASINNDGAAPTGVGEWTAAVASGTGSLNGGGTGLAGVVGQGSNSSTVSGTLGGRGGNGGNGTGANVGGIAGNANQVTTSYGSMRGGWQAASGQLVGRQGLLTPAASSVAGNGGGDGTNRGGGGGSAGGHLLLNALELTNNGRISSNGGKGGTPVAGNAGGGGGGGGGLVQISTTAPVLGTGTVTATGGAAGAGVGTGTAGTAGANGTVLIINWAA